MDVPFPAVAPQLGFASADAEPHVGYFQLASGIPNDFQAVVLVDTAHNWPQTAEKQLASAHALSPQSTTVSCEESVVDLIY